MAQPLPAPDQVSFTALAPADLERLTGLSRPLQRVWRSRGLLAPREGAQASFDVRDAAEVAIRFRLGQVAVSPNRARDIGAAHATSLLWFVLMETPNLIEALAATETRLDEVERSYRSDEMLITRVTGLSSPLMVDRYVVGLESGDIQTSSSLDALSDYVREPSAWYLDLLSLGSRFGLRAERPLLTLHYDGVERDSRPLPKRRLLRP